MKFLWRDTKFSEIGTAIDSQLDDTSASFIQFWKDLKSSPQDVIDEIVAIFGTLDDKVLAEFENLKNGVSEKLSGILDSVPAPVKKLLGLEGELEPEIEHIGAGRLEHVCGGARWRLARHFFGGSHRARFLGLLFFLRRRLLPFGLSLVALRLW